LRGSALTIVGLIGLALAQSGKGATQGFEAGDPAVTKTGDASVQGTFEGIAPPQGVNQYLITTIAAADGEGLNPVSGSDAIAHPGLQNFFNAINATTSDNISLADVEGSGFYFTFTLNPGQTAISFSYDFLTNETRATPDTAIALLYNSSALLSSQIVATSNTPNSVLLAGSPFQFQTGYNTFTINIANPGTYTLALGIYDRGDGDHNSGLLVDNFQTIPEPSALGLGFAGTMLLIALRRVIKKTS
jgi:hypothetical protein